MFSIENGEIGVIYKKIGPKCKTESVFLQKSEFEMEKIYLYYCLLDFWRM